MKKYLLVTATIVLLSVLVFACSSSAPGAPAPAPTQAPAPSTAAPAASAATESVADFYKGKAFTIGVTAGTGGMVDVYARLIAPQLSDMIGVRAGVVNNAAAGGMAYFNEFYNNVKPDGLHVLIVSVGTTWRPWLIDDPAVKYDPMKFGYLGGLKAGNYILGVSPKTPYKTADDLKKAKGLVFAASAPTSGLTLTNLLAIEVLGLDGKVITGYNGTEGRMLAVAQGEADGLVGASDTQLKNQKDGTIRPIFQIGLKRLSPWPNLPCLAEVTEQTETNKALLKSLDAYSDARMLISVPGTPPERMKYLADAFVKVFASESFQAAVKKTTGEEWGGSLTAEECTASAKDVPSYKPLMKIYDDLMKKYGK
jgi:tripartite-type tricarboxylate transporter receptor subunit TctC